jgi:hypothetical protein
MHIINSKYLPAMRLAKEWCGRLILFEGDIRMGMEHLIRVLGFRLAAPQDMSVPVSQFKRRSARSI